MLTRLKQVLRSDDQDDLTGELLRRFWTRPSSGLMPRRSAAAAAPAPEATVVDLARWARARRDPGR
jgi:hypothetical protein